MERLAKLVNKLRDLHPHLLEQQQEGQQETQYFVEEDEYGITITENPGTPDTAQYFCTPRGSWLWLTGPGSPFDGDALVSPEKSRYLDSLVEDSRVEKLALNIPSSASLRNLSASEYLISTTHFKR